MKRLVMITLTILVVALTLASTKVLVIGVGEYNDTSVIQLQGAVKDAESFSEIIGRTVDNPSIELIKNPTLTGLKVSILEWARKSEPGDTLILYYSGHGYSIDNDTYLIPSDVETRYIKETAYNFTTGLKSISSDIRAKDVLIIIDACYSGSLVKDDRPLTNAKIKEGTIEEIAKDRGYVFLLSSRSDETSKERPEGGGQFTHYLLKGIEGEANRDNDDKITVKEVYDYLREEVRKATSNNQTPVMVGDRDIVIAKDMRSLYTELASQIIILSREGKLPAEQLQLYTKVLFQKENEDNELEKKVRSYLLNYLKDRNLTSLIAQTTVAMMQPGTTPQTSQQAQSQVTTPQTQTKGNCLLKIIAGNELAKSGSVYLNGKEEGTLENGQLTIFDLGIGIYTLAIDGEKIDRQEIEIKFENDYETREKRIEGKPATRVLRIVTIPPNAKIWIDGRELSSRSPWQEALEVGKAYEIEVYVEGYGRDKRIANVPTKGELIPFNITIPEASVPDKPQLTYPSNNAKDIPTGNLTLKWESKESNLTYRVEFDGKTYTTNNKSYTVSTAERGETYSWKVVAVNEFGKETTSDEYSFRTMDNRVPSTPSNPNPSNNATNQPLTMTLSWECSDPDGDAITYDVYFGTSSNPTTKLSSGQTGKSLNRTNLSYGTPYYWKVVATDSKGATTEGSVWRFTTQSNRPPSEPFNPRPSNYEINIPTTMTLSWECSDPDGDTVTYDVCFGTNSNPTTKISTNQSGKTLSRSNLSIGTTYYWKVVAKDSKGATTEGPVWRFATQSNRAPNTPSNPNPANNATNQPLTVTLSWECSDPDGDAITYDVYFGTSTNTMTKVSSSQTGKMLNRSNLSIGTTYYWRVVATDSKGATTEGPVWRFTTSAVPEGMVLVEKGSFTMGDTDGYPNEKPTHKVTFTYNFYIGKYETTFDEYDAFCNATGRSKPSDRGWGRGTRPVIYVSWNDAVAYCNWLSEKEKLPKAYDTNGNFLDKDGRITTDPSRVVGYRLPTEAEWEYAARGGNKSKGYKYSGSDNLDNVAWYKDNSGRKTQEVGKKAANELGIYDMSGNVREWCSDWFGYYSSSAQTNPYNSETAYHRVKRGGSWDYNAAGVRVAFRNDYSPTDANDLGFRICRTVP